MFERAFAGAAVKRLLVIVWVLSWCVETGAHSPQWSKIIPSETVALRDAQSISASAEGLLYIADTGNHRIIAVDHLGAMMAETGGLGSAHGKFQWPRVVIANRGNAVWVLDYGNRRIEKFTRSLDYQGTLEIRERGDNTPHQPEAMALSPQGDLFVFDKDSDRLIRYDPLLKPQTELGSGSGAQFVSAISAMAFVSKAGLFWWGRGGREIYHADALLNPSMSLRLPDSAENLFLADSDTCLIYGYSRTVMAQCSWDAVPDTLISERDVREQGLIRIGSCSAAGGGILYLLDRGTSSVYRISGLQP